MWHNLQRAWVVTQREIRDQFRDWRIIVPIVMLTLFFPGLMNFTAEKVVNYVQRFNAPLIGDRLIPFLLMIVGFFPISVSLVIALESFVGEKERRSIEPLLSSPLTDLQLYLGKLFAVMVPPLFASYLGIGVYLIGVYNQVGWVPDSTLLIQVVVLASVQTLVMVSGAVVISTQTTSARAANLLASFIIVPMALLLIGESMVMFWARYNVLWWAIFGQILIAALLIRAGIAYFNREELLGRELDTLNLPYAWRTFKQEFLGDARRFGDWLRVNYLATLRYLLVPGLLMALAIIAAMWVGSTQAERFPLPADIIQWDKLDEGFLEGVDELRMLRFFTVGGAGYILFHNLRVVMLATLLGVFSFGVLGVLVLMMPFMLIGYFMATVAHAGLASWLFFVAFVLPHGVLEIPAIILTGAAILRLGATLAAPAEGKTIGQAWLGALAMWVKTLLLWGIPLFLGGAFLEVFLTPRVVFFLLGN